MMLSDKHFLILCDTDFEECRVAANYCFALACLHNRSCYTLQMLPPKKNWGQHCWATADELYSQNPLPCHQMQFSKIHQCNQLWQVQCMWTTAHFHHD